MLNRILATLFALCLTCAVHAQSTVITYQGQLRVSGTPYTGAAEFQFTIWDAASGGAQLAATTPATTSTSVTDGLFTASLDFGASAFTGADRWLDIQVRTGGGAFTPLTTRQQLTATPYAVRAREAAGVPGGAITGAMIAADAVGDAQIATIAAAGTVANSATSADSVNAAGAIVARDVNGAFAAGGVEVQGGTTVGALHVTGTREGFFATPVGLIENLNTTGSSGPALRLVTSGGDSVDGVLSVSSGGVGDLAVFGNAFVFVSRLTTNGTWSARAYEASDYLKVGFNHQLTGNYSSVAGGSGNTNLAHYTTIAGGSQNLADTGSSHSMISGGFRNAIGTNSSYGAILGGYNNLISSNSFAAVVAGGWNNVAASNYTYAAGRFARAYHEGAFVWSDASAGPFLSSAPNQFSVRAVGGARFVTSGAGMTLDGQPVLAGTVGGGNLADNSVSTLKIADGSVTLDKMFNGSVNSAKIIDGTVGSVDLEPGGVTTEKLALNAVANINLGDGAVSGSKIADGAVSGAKIADGAIANADINAAAAIADSKLATISTAGKVSDSALGANVALLNRVGQRFTGTLGLGNNGTLFTKVQFGTATVGTGVAGANTFTIPFPTAFATAPKVFVTAKGNDTVDTFVISTRAVTTSNFKVNIIRVDQALGWGQSLQVDWYAVE